MPKHDPLSGLACALLGGTPAMQEHMQKTGQSLDQALASLSSAANPPAGGGATRGAFGDILGSLLGGAPEAGSEPAAGGDPMSVLLSGLLGGGTPQGGAPMQGAPATEGDPMSVLLSGLLGGGTAQGGALMQGAPEAGADPMSMLLGSLLGGGAQGAVPGGGALGNNAFLAPIVDAIAAKIGIKPEIAQVIVSFALTQLMSQQRDPQLAQVLGGKGAVSQKYLRDSGLASQLAQQAGLDNKTAMKSLQQVFQALGTQMGEGTMDDRQQSLESWLRTK